MPITGSSSIIKTGKSARNSEPLDQRDFLFFQLIFNYIDSFWFFVRKREFTGQRTLKRTNHMSEKENIAKLVVICDKIIKWGFCVLAFLLPLFILPFGTNVIEANKQLLLIVFAFLMLVVWLGRTIATGEFELKKGWLNLAIVVFLIFYLISAVFSKNPYQSLVGAGNVVAESFATLLSLAILFFIMVNGFKKRQDLDNLILGFIISGLLVGIFGLAQLTGHFLLPWDFARNVGFNTVGSVNSLEIFLAALLVLSAALFAENRGAFWRRVLYGAAAVFFLLVVLAINFINVWWGLILAAVLIIALGIINRDRVSQFSLILPMIILVFSVMILLARPAFLLNWFNVPAEYSPSLKATLEIDKQALKERLFTGSGPGGYLYEYGLYRSVEVNQSDFWNYSFRRGYSKNSSLPTTIGIFGSLTWLLLVAGFAIYGFLGLIRRRGSNWVLALAVFSSWLMLVVLQFIYATNLTLEFAFWFLLGLAFLTLKTCTTDGGEDNFEKTEKISVSFSRTSPIASVLSFVFVIVAVVAISALYLIGVQYYADVLYQRGLNLVNANIEQSSQLISRAVLLNPYNDLYQRSLSQAALARVNQELVKPQSATRNANIQNLIVTAVNIAKRSTEVMSYNVENWAQRGFVYRSVIPYTADADQWAIDSYIQATKLEPQNPSYYFELARTYVLSFDIFSPSVGQDTEKIQKMKDYLTKAVEALSRAIELKPNYAPALFTLAQVYDRQGQLDEAVAKTIQTQNLYPNDVGVAFQLGVLYFKQSKWTLAKAALERTVALDANYSNARYFLGLIYDKLGEKVNAINQFVKIEELNPDNQDVKNILVNLRAGKSASGGIPAKPSELPISEKQPQAQ